MGDRDLLKPLLERKGAVHFGRVLMKPGKPLTFATLDLEAGRKLLVFGLPGRNSLDALTWSHCLLAGNGSQAAAVWPDRCLTVIHPMNLQLVGHPSFTSAFYVGSVLRDEATITHAASVALPSTPGLRLRQA